MPVMVLGCKQMLKKWKNDRYIYYHHYNYHSNDDEQQQPRAAGKAELLKRENQERRRLLEKERAAKLDQRIQKLEEQSNEKNKKVSIDEPTIEEVSGAINHFFFLNLSKTCTSINCAIKKAVPEPIAILIDIKSAKSVENNIVNPTPRIKPRYTIFLAIPFPKDRFARSVIKKAIG